MTAEQPCVFIVDDDEGIRKSLSRALEARGYLIKAFASAEEFLETYENNEPGCLVLDYGMPHMSGLELQELLVASGQDIPIIFITGHGGIPESVQAMKLGAIDFLEKPFQQDTLIERIDAAFEADAHRRKCSRKVHDAKVRFDKLTDREKEIMEFLVLNPSATSSKDVARALDISPRTVDHHRARILEKMQTKSVVELVDLSINTGLFSQ